MNFNNLKNIVVLKDLPSNIIDEVVVVLKKNKYAKKIEYIEKNKKISYCDKNNNTNYIIQEAEDIISSCISKIDNNEEKKIKQNYFLKYYSIISSIVITILLIKLFN